jgi:acetoin utilization deacetylase AcuC-like enzyme
VHLFYSDVFVLPLPSHHRFPMGKYARLRDRLLAGGDFALDDFSVSAAVTDGEITRVHCPDYLGRVARGALSAAEQKAIGFPWSERMVERSRRSSGRLKLTKRGLARRDEMVLGTLAARGIPVAITMAGGYARDIEDSVDIHANTIRTARRIWESA